MDKTMETFNCDIATDKIDMVSGEIIKRKNNPSEHFYRCYTCSKYFSTADFLLKHQKSHEIKRVMYSCRECGLRYQRKGDMENHLKLHQSGADIVCFDCGQQFRREQDLKMHETNKALEKPKTCLVCKKVFYMKCKLDIHTLYQCTDKHLFTKKQVQKLKYLERKDFELNKIQRVVPSKKLIFKKSDKIARLEKMKNEKNCGSVLNFKCSRCTSSFVSLTKLTEHMRINKHKNMCNDKVVRVNESDIAMELNYVDSLSQAHRIEENSVLESKLSMPTMIKHEKDTNPLTPPPLQENVMFHGITGDNKINTLYVDILTESRDDNMMVGNYCENLLNVKSEKEDFDNEDGHPLPYDGVMENTAKHEQCDKHLIVIQPEYEVKHELPITKSEKIEHIEQTDNPLVAINEHFYSMKQEWIVIEPKDE